MTNSSQPDPEKSIFEQITGEKPLYQRDGSPKLFKVPTYEGENYSTCAIHDAIRALRADIGSVSLGDGTNPIGDNVTRAHFASEALAAYAKETGIYSGETVFLALNDMLNDMRHLLDFIGLDEDSDADLSDGYPTDIVDSVLKDTNYQAEIRGEF